MSEEAIRHPKRGKAHRPVPLRTTVFSSAAYRRGGHEAKACDRYVPAIAAGLTERVPLAQVAPADRCKQCWPKEEQ